MSEPIPSILPSPSKLLNLDGKRVLITGEVLNVNGGTVLCG